MAFRWAQISIVMSALLLGGGIARADDEEAPPRPNREGFTLEVGVGGAVTLLVSQLSSFGFDSSTGTEDSSTYYKTKVLGGIAPISLGIGGFLTENVALMFRTSGTAFFRGASSGVNLFYGPVVQLWANDALMFGAGLGLGVYSSDIQVGVDAFGIATSLRASYAIFTNEDHAVSLGVELIPGFFPDTHDFTLGAALLAEWQLL